MYGPDPLAPDTLGVASDFMRNHGGGVLLALWLGGTVLYLARVALRARRFVVAPAAGE